MKTLHTFTDGGCSGNWQQDYSKRSMVWVATDQFGDVLLDRQEEHGGSNNIAELLAVRDVIKYAVDAHYEVVCITSDSANTVTWFNAATLSGRPMVGKKINNPERTESILIDIIDLSKKVQVFIRWRPREENLAGQFIENRYKL